jgi:transketolase N-terminal domain/subunit
MGKQLDVADLQKKANDLRADVICMLEAAGSGHTAGSLDLAEIVNGTIF